MAKIHIGISIYL
jgi:hypothetical protein